MSDSGPLLEVDDLHVRFRTRDGVVSAVNGMSFTLDAGETIAILGESGSGKSVTAQAIMGILPSKTATIPQGSIRYRGTELVGLRERDYRQLRGAKIAMVFQDALSALNPVTSVGRQVSEMFRVRGDMSRRQAKAAAIEVMSHVGIPDPARRFGDYPHQFSGGMRQRVMIATMIALRPSVLIADEPTTALDVTVQAQIMDLLKELQRETGTGLILITHDLGVVASVADRIAVMYAGRVMEQGNVDEIYQRQANPYTVGLLESIPQIDERVGRLPAIPGLPPNLLAVPPGCPYHLRCAMPIDPCFEDPAPPFTQVAPGHHSMCWRAEEVYAGERVAR
jgi:oligopeptide transport system ATP-binding protein